MEISGFDCYTIEYPLFLPYNQFVPELVTPALFEKAKQNMPQIQGIESGEICQSESIFLL